MTGAVNMKKIIDKTTVTKTANAKRKLPLYSFIFFVILIIFPLKQKSVNIIITN
jgi:hypothetical protein